MFKKPNTIVTLVLLWLVLAAIFFVWGGYSLSIVLDIPSWFVDYGSEFRILTPILHFGYLLSTIIWLQFSVVFVIFSYGTLKKDHKIWTTGLIVSTIFLVILGLMIASFMVNLALFQDIFSIWGIITSIIAFMTDLGIIFFITRPMTKIYFELE